MKPTRAAFDLMLQGSLALADMESNGIFVDVPYLDEAIAEMERRIAKLEERLKADAVWAAWQEEFGSRANLGSRDQLGKLVFGKLGHKSTEKTATGKVKTDEVALKKVKLPFVRRYLRMAELQKAKTTYLEGIKRELDDKGILHPSFNLHLVKTFRSSSDSPNWQNLPIRDPEMGKIIRSCVVAREGHVLVENDFKGIEVCVSACYHRDPVMLEYIRDPSKDMHRDMAAQLYMLKPEQVSKMTRFAAKSFFVFAQFYGDWYIHCTKGLWDAIDSLKLTTAKGMPLKDWLTKKGIKELGVLNPKQDPLPGTFERHVKKVEEDFWQRRFRVYKQWKDRRYEEYLKCGEFLSLTGFVERGLYSRNDTSNHPIQGSAFHCLLWVAIRLNRWLKKRKMRSKLIGQIHDSLNGDVHLDELQVYLNKVKNLVSVDLPRAWPWICVPMTIEAEVSPEQGNWFDKVEWIEKGDKWQPKS